MIIKKMRKIWRDVDYYRINFRNSNVGALIKFKVYSIEGDNKAVSIGL